MLSFAFFQAFPGIVPDSHASIDPNTCVVVYVNLQENLRYRWIWFSSVMRAVGQRHRNGTYAKFVSRSKDQDQKFSKFWVRGLQRSFASISCQPAAGKGEVTAPTEIISIMHSWQISNVVFCAEVRPDCVGRSAFEIRAYYFEHQLRPCQLLAKTPCALAGLELATRAI